MELRLRLQRGVGVAGSGVEALSSSETSVLTRATGRNIPEDAIIHIYRRENLKSYIAILMCQMCPYITFHLSIPWSLWVLLVMCPKPLHFPLVFSCL
jgi:hypothetical protein